MQYFSTQEKPILGALSEFCLNSYHCSNK